jgi:hypothetical protein
VHRIIIVFFSIIAVEACTDHIDCGVEVSKEGRKQGNIEHTVVPNVALWNAGFQ